jgi:hypothetical protein
MMLLQREIEEREKINANHRVQHYGSKGTCEERGGTNDTNGEGKDSRAIGDTTLQSCSKKNEDRVR